MTALSKHAEVDAKLSTALLAGGLSSLPCHPLHGVVHAVLTAWRPASRRVNNPRERERRKLHPDYKKQLTKLSPCSRSGAGWRGVGELSSTCGSHLWT